MHVVLTGMEENPFRGPSATRATCLSFAKVLAPVDAAAAVLAAVPQETWSILCIYIERETCYVHQ